MTVSDDLFSRIRLCIFLCLLRMSVDRLAQGEDVVSNSLVLPITKFSYATTAIERTSPLGWTHLSGGGDLVAIFDHVRIRELRSGLAKERRRLHVRRGTERLVCSASCFLPAYTA